MSTAADQGYLIPKLLGNPAYNTGPKPTDESLASPHVRDLLLSQDSPIELLDLRSAAFALGRDEGNTSPVREVHFTEEGRADVQHEVRVDGDGNVKWFAEAINEGFGTGSSPGANNLSGSAFCTGYFYYLPSDGSQIRITGKHKCTGKGQGISGKGETKMHVFAYNSGYLSGNKKDIYSAEIGSNKPGEVKSIFAQVTLDPAYPYVCISFEMKQSGGGGSNGGTANAPGQRAEIYDFKAEFLT
jgi:hypothetical protein